MAAAPSAATGATGLERLLRIFLMKLSESQNAANNTYFSYDRFSDQSEKLVRNSARKLQEHREPSKKPATPPETTASPTDNQTSKRTQTPPNESRVNSRKPYFTEQKSKRTVENAKSQNKSQANSERWLHQHTTTQKTTKNIQELTLWMGASFTRSHGGRLMILPVDQNVGTCLVKGSTCAPLQTSVLLPRSTSRTCKRTERRRSGRSHSNAQVSDRTTKY